MPVEHIHVSKIKMIASYINCDVETGIYKVAPEDNPIINNQRWAINVDEPGAFSVSLFQDISRYRYDVNRIMSPYYNDEFIHGKELLETLFQNKVPITSSFCNTTSLLDAYKKISDIERCSKSYYEITNILMNSRSATRSIHYFMAKAIISVLKKKNNPNASENDDLFKVLANRKYSPKYEFGGYYDDSSSDDDCSQVEEDSYYSDNELDAYFSVCGVGYVTIEIGKLRTLTNNIEDSADRAGLLVLDYLTHPSQRGYLRSMYFLIGEYYRKRPELFSSSLDILQLFPQLYAEMKGAIVSITDTYRTKWYFPFQLRKSLLNHTVSATSDSHSNSLLVKYASLRNSSFENINLVCVTYRKEDTSNSISEEYNPYFLLINEQMLNLDVSNPLKYEPREESFSFSEYKNSYME